MHILYFGNKGHIENEVDMNDVKTCRHNCKTYDVTEPKHCYKNLFCAKISWHEITQICYCKKFAKR